MKKLQIRIVAIILSLLIATTLLYHPVKVKAAAVAAPTALEIVSYIMSVTGAIDLVTGGGVNSIAGSIRDQLANKVSELMGTGIYTDSNGNYVFSSEATKAIYDTIGGNSNLSTRVISSFIGLTPIAGLAYFGNPIVSNDCRNFIDQNRTLYSNYLVALGNYNNYSTSMVSCYFIDTSNIAFFAVTYDSDMRGYYLNFYNSNGSSIGVSARRWFNGTVSDITITKVGFMNRNTSWNGNFYDNPVGIYDFNTSNDLGIVNDNVSSFFNSLPLSNGNGSIIWSNRSILVGVDSSYAYNQYKYPSGVVYANNYENIPTVSPDVITNNNWSKIYNDYVTNVSNNVQYFYNTETNQYNYDEMYKYIKSFNNNITNEVNNGSNDIEQNIEYNNSWLSLIYDTLRSISVKLDNLLSGGGSSSCPWTETDIQNMLSSLSRLENSLSQDVTTNQQIFAYLATLNQSILSIASSNNPQTIYNEYNNYYAALNGLPDADVLDFIGKTDVIKALLPTVAPFGFIALGSSIISGLAAEPVDPVFVMPLQFNHSLVGQTVNIDEEITIDLTPFNSARIVLNAFLVLVFLLSLIFITIELIHRFIAILGG